MPLQLYKIASVEVGSAGASSINFTSIPQGYTDLKIVASLRTGQSSSNGWSDCRFYFNSSTTNYVERFLYGTGSTVGSITVTGEPGNIWTAFTANASNTANTFSSVEIYIPNYTSSNSKSYSSDSVTENNATSAITSLDAGLWNNSAAITSITITPYGTGSYVANTTATLYGIL
jgi:hypothetical protein